MAERHASSAPLILSGGRIERWVRRCSQSERCLWHGKSFDAISDHEGWGWNRIWVGPALAVCPYRTYIAASKHDGAPALVLDFDVPKNPWFERPVRDELREVIPGVFLGISGFRLFGKYHAGGWFAVDTTRQTPLLGI